MWDLFLERPLQIHKNITKLFPLSNNRFRCSNNHQFPLDDLTQFPSPFSTQDLSEGSGGRGRLGVSVDEGDEGSTLSCRTFSESFPEADPIEDKRFVTVHCESCINTITEIWCKFCWICIHFVKFALILLNLYKLNLYKFR